jgi:hypothetical protein
MFTGSWPPADVIVMGMVLHNWSTERQVFLVRRAWEALASGGAFVVVENLIDDERRENVFGLMMSLNMLVSCGNATDFTGKELAEWCRSAGFQRTEIIHLAGPCSAGVAWK